MKKNVKFLTFVLAAMLTISSVAISSNSRLLGVDDVSAATTGGNTNTKPSTQTTQKPKTTQKTQTTKTTQNSNAKINRMLAFKSFGDDVKQLQTYLNQHGYKLKVDGIYGPKTLAAVKDYQKKKGLRVDGIVGPKTLAKIIPPTTVKPQEPVVKEQKVTVKIGKVDYAAHGTKAFTVAVAAVAGDKIVAAYIDDYQFLGKDTAKGVPNSDSDFGKNYPQGLVLASKMTNAEYYSGLMKEKANATVPIDKNFAAIETFVKGKTIAELEAVLSSTPKDKMADAVSGATLQDTYGYVSAIIEAAKAAKDNVTIEVDAKDINNIKIGKVDYAAHGTKAFTVAVAAVVGEKIVAAYMDDYQFMSKDVAKGVPNSDSDFGKNYPQGLVLASKMTNAEYYSGLMKEKANATVPIDKNFDYIRAFVTGKTISELEAVLSSTPKDKMADAVSGATLQDTYGYVSAIVESAKVAK